MSVRTLSKLAPHGLVTLDGAARNPGTVWLVGAGPGDPDLLTLKAARLLASADVIVHDGLVSEAVLALSAPSARRISVAKRKSKHSLPQADISRLLIALARQGLTVLRLKGGDPFIFGRGGEEMLACREAGIPCEIVPGISAALAASASIGGPLTHRHLAQTVSFVTGHAAEGEPDLDWVSLARPNQTLVVFMGLSTAEIIAQRLMAAGRAAATPAAIVLRASLPDEACVLTTLGELPSAAKALPGPALLIIGEAMSLADTSRLETMDLAMSLQSPERRIAR